MPSLDQINFEKINMNSQPNRRSNQSAKNHAVRWFLTLALTLFITAMLNFPPPPVSASYACLNPHLTFSSPASTTSTTFTLNYSGFSCTNSSTYHYTNAYIFVSRTDKTLRSASLYDTYYHLAGTIQTSIPAGAISIDLTASGTSAVINGANTFYIDVTVCTLSTPTLGHYIKNAFTIAPTGVCTNMTSNPPVQVKSITYKAPVPTPTPTPVPTPKPTPTPTPKPTPTPVPTPRPTPVPTPRPTPVTTPGPTSQPTPIITPGPTSYYTPPPGSSFTPGPTLPPGYSAPPTVTTTPNGSSSLGPDQSPSATDETLPSGTPCIGTLLEPCPTDTPSDTPTATDVIAAGGDVPNSSSDGGLPIFPMLIILVVVVSGFWFWRRSKMAVPNYIPWRHRRANMVPKNGRVK